MNAENDHVPAIILPQPDCRVPLHALSGQQGETGVIGPGAWPSRDHTPACGRGLRRELDRPLEKEYIGSMKVKTSITLSEDVLEAIDQHSKHYKSRSDFIEVALWAFVTQMIRNEQNARDIQIINQRADYLNEEAADVLAYQVAL